MSSIDKRIVQMQFDNQNFESGVKTTMSTLQRLNEKLKMKSSTGGLDEVSKSVSKLSSGLPGLSSLSAGVETVSSKFSALGVVAVTALANITNSAVNAGKNLVRSFTMDPVMDGFREYELKMNSIQTILTNTARHGTTLKDVNNALNELNEYSDQTIYNFAQMTDNIGKATAAGLKLDTAVTFVKGMSNAAAGFGVDATRMAGATYQMTQALAAGVVRLQDWNSLQQAGMGGVPMQEQMYAAAESLGVFVDKSKPFRDSLESGWLTAEVFTKAMENMANDPSLTKAATEVTSFTKLLDTLKESVGSGWAQSFEHIFGDKEESTKLWTGINEAIGGVITKSAEARNKMLSDWKELGGRDAMIKGFTNIFGSLGKGFKAIGESWREVFPSWTGAKLADMSEKFAKFTEKIKMSDETARKIKDTFRGVFNVFKTVGSAIGGVIKAFAPLLGIFKPIGSGLLTVTSSIGNFITKMSNAISKSNVFTKIGENVGNAFVSIGEHISNAYDKITGFFNELDFSNVTSSFSKVASSIGQFMSTIGEGLGKALGSINFDTLLNMGKGLASLGIFKVVKNIFDEFKGVGDGLTGVFESFSGIGENVKEVLNSTKESLTAWQNSLNAGTLMKLAGAIAILSGSLLLLASINPVQLATALAGMAGLFAELSLAMLAINKIGDIKGLITTSTGMILMSTAILILSGAMKKLSGLKVDEVLTGLVSIAGLLATMVIISKAFSKSSSGLIKTSTGLIIFGGAMHVMAGALKKLGEIDPDTLGAGLFALLGVLTELGVFLAGAKYGKLGITTATGILILSGALLVLEEALSRFGSLDTGVILTGLAAMAAVLTEITILNRLCGGGLSMIGTALGVTAMSGAMYVMTGALKSLGSIQWEEMARGLTAMAGGLVLFGAAAYLINGGMLTLLAVGVGAMSAALLVLSAALKSMGSMSWEEIGKGLVVLAGALTILGAAMYAMTGTIVGAAAMLVMAGALAILTPQLMLLGQMSLAEIGSALLILAGAFTVLGVAGLVLTSVVPTLLGLGVAVGLLGVGCLAAGVGITAFATGLGLVATVLGASGSAILDFIKEILNLLPQIGLKAGEAMVNFAAAIGTGAPQIITAFSTLLTAILTAIQQNVPLIAQTGVDIIVAFAQALATGIPQLVTAGLEMVLGVLQGIADNIGPIVEAGADICINFMDGVSKKLPEIIDSGIDLALSFVEGVADGISNNKDRLEAAVEKAINAMIDAGIAVIKGSFNSFTKYGGDLLKSFCNGIKNKYNDVKTAVTGAIDRAKQACSRCGSALIQAGRDLIEGLKNGIKQKAMAVYNAASTVVTNAINAAKKALKINSPSRVFMEIGRFVDQGFIIGLEKYSNNVNKTATNLAEGVVDNFSNPLSNIAALINGEVDVNPTIRPVLDLSNVQNGSRRIGDMLGTGSLTLSTSKANLMTKSIGQIQNGPDNSDIVSALKDLKASMADNRPSYTVNGITYDDGSNITSAVETLVRAAKIERRI